MGFFVCPGGDQGVHFDRDANHKPTARSHGPTEPYDGMDYLKFVFADPLSETLFNNEFAKTLFQLIQQEHSRSRVDCRGSSTTTMGMCSDDESSSTEESGTQMISHFGITILRVSLQLELACA